MIGLHCNSTVNVTGIGRFRAKFMQSVSRKRESNVNSQREALEKKTVDDETYLKQVHVYLKDTLLDSLKTQG